MKRLALISLGIIALASCSSSDEPKKKVAQPPPGTGEYSNIGWNRPAKWEGAGKMGGMMPQSH